MKANHNHKAETGKLFIVVVNLANWQNESKSQLNLFRCRIADVVVNLANWQNESKSQLPRDFFLCTP